MAIYHFNLTDGAREPDLMGTDLPDHEAARLEAVRLSGEVASERPAALWADGSLQVEVTDDAGMVLFLVTTIVTQAAAASPPG